MPGRHKKSCGVGLNPRFCGSRRFFFKIHASFWSIDLSSGLLSQVFINFPNAQILKDNVYFYTAHFCTLWLSHSLFVVSFFCERQTSISQSHSRSLDQHVFLTSEVYSSLLPDSLRLPHLFSVLLPTRQRFVWRLETLHALMFRTFSTRYMLSELSFFTCSKPNALQTTKVTESYVVQESRQGSCFQISIKLLSLVCFSVNRIVQQRKLG